MNERKVFYSIIIPTYNSAEFIESCIKSVQAQTCKDWEILLIDGCSTDATIKLAEAIASQDNRVKICSEKDEGIYDAMNKGIQKSTGQWLYFLGSDDCLYDAFVLEKIKNMTEEQPDISVFYGDVYSNRFNGRYAGAFTVEKLYHQNICHQAIFLKRIVFEMVGNFNLLFKGWADYDHNIRWFLNQQIRHRYADLVIANYADGGFSSTAVDNRMLESKAEIFLKQGFWKFPGSFTRGLLLTAAIQKKKEKSWGPFLIYKSGFYLFLIRDKLKLLFSMK